MIEGLVSVNEIFTVLDAFLKSWNEVLGRRVIVEIFETIDEVGMLGEMKVLSCFALFAHLTVDTAFESADEGHHLLVPAAYHVLVHSQSL